MAQELQRRTAIAGEALLEPLVFWQNQDHEIDFVVANKEFMTSQVYGQRLEQFLLG